MATVEQPTLFRVLAVGEHVKVFHESGELQACGIVKAIIWHPTTGAPRTVAVKTYDGRILLRPAERVAINEDVTVL